MHTTSSRRSSERDRRYVRPLDARFQEGRGRELGWIGISAVGMRIVTAIRRLVGGLRFANIPTGATLTDFDHAVASDELRRIATGTNLYQLNHATWGASKSETEEFRKAP